MRIIGYIEHATYMVTVFKMDDKFSVKFEKNLLEQTYKYRGGQHMMGIEDVKRVIDAAFIKRVDNIFETMESTRLDSLRVEDGVDEFDEIV